MKILRKKNDLLLRKVILILTQNSLNCYFKSFRIAIDSVAFESCAYFNAV